MQGSVIELCKVKSIDSKRQSESKQQYSGDRIGFRNKESTIGRLSMAINVWKKAGASDYILNVIDEGYGILFTVLPYSAVVKSNKSSLENACFVQEKIDKLVEKACFVQEKIDKLVEKGYVSEIIDIPEVVSPLTVAFSKSGKHINSCIHQFMFKLEDGTVARNIFSKGEFLLKFDLKKRLPYFH